MIADYSLTVTVAAAVLLGAPGCSSQAEPPKELKIDLGGVTLKLVLIRPGKFMMGSPETEKGHTYAEVQREVTISKPFYMGVMEVTQAQYETVMGTNWDDFGGLRLPGD